MALFRRKSNTTVLPEIERYYEAEKRDRVGMAWLLAVVSVLGATALLLGLLFGGRWVYRSLTDKNDKTHVTVKAPTKSDNSNNASDDKSTDDKSSSTATTPTTSAPATSSTSTTQPSPSASNLANTGPESVLPAFILATVLGIWFYRAKLVKN